MSESSERPHSALSSEQNSRPPSAVLSPRSYRGSMLPTLSREMASTSTLDSEASSKKDQWRGSRRRSKVSGQSPSGSIIVKNQRHVEPLAPPIIPLAPIVNIFDSDPPRSDSPMPSVGMINYT